MQRSNHPPKPSPKTQTDCLSDENARLRRENQQLSRTLAQMQSVARTIVDEPDKRELTLRLAEQIAEWLKAERVMVGTLLNGAIILESVKAFYS